MTVPAPSPITVVRPGLQTTIQDAGRPGYLARGIPPAGPQDWRSFAVGSVLVGNPLPAPPLTPGDRGAAGLEMLAVGPELRFESDAVVALTGGHVNATLDGEEVETWTAVTVPAGATLAVGKIGPGMRAYLAVVGGFEVAPYLGSRATFVRGGQGGLDGRALRKGDSLPRGEAPAHAGASVGRSAPPELRRSLDARPWTVRVVPGPQDHLFTEQGVELFFTAQWKLSPTSDRMGFRFIGPALEMRERPEYLIRDAGSGPADIVDDIIPVGGIQVPGGIEPIAMGVENPTAGGYAKIGTVISTDLGVLGQIRPMEPVRFAAISAEDAQVAAQAELAEVSALVEAG